MKLFFSSVDVDGLYDRRRRLKNILQSQRMVVQISRSQCSTVEHSQQVCDRLSGGTSKSWSTSAKLPYSFFLFLSAIQARLVVWGKCSHFLSNCKKYCCGWPSCVTTFIEKLNYGEKPITALL